MIQEEIRDDKKGGGKKGQKKDEKGEENICRNIKNLVRDECSKEIKMDTFLYNSKLIADDNCAKAQWARSCDLTWDGITNKENICD